MRNIEFATDEVASTLKRSSVKAWIKWYDRKNQVILSVYRKLSTARYSYNTSSQFVFCSRHTNAETRIIVVRLAEYVPGKLGFVNQLTDKSTKFKAVVCELCVTNSTKQNPAVSYNVASEAVQKIKIPKRARIEIRKTSEEI